VGLFFVFTPRPDFFSQWGIFMDALYQSFGLVLASEMGDKTQLLALVLALRFKKPLVVMLGILIATLLNHGLATAVGGWIGSQFSQESLKIALSVVFVAFAVWVLIPDKIDEDDSKTKTYGTTSALVTTVILFFLAEMGDKTQIATIALGAKFQAPLLVTIGTTLGMLVADGLAVVFGERLIKVIPMKAIRIFSALLFAAFGIGIYLSR
jgi:putative Ca2+/H+ antiporter (TMEM165/GDT1 family)